MIVKPTNLIAIRRDLIYDNLSSNDICNMFNEFLIEFERMENSDATTTKSFLDAVEDIVDATLSIVPYKLLDPSVLSHPLMCFLHQMIIDILDNWRTPHLHLIIQETDIFLKIILIFIHVGEHAPLTNDDEDRRRIEDLVVTKHFLYVVREQIDDMILCRQGMMDDPNICTLGLLAIRLLQGYPFHYNMERNECLISDLVINCLDSCDFIRALHKLQHGKVLTDADRYLLFTCWDYVPFTCLLTQELSITTSSIDHIQDFYNDVLTRLERALDEPPPVALPSIAYIFERCHQILNIHDLRSFDTHANYIIDRLTKMLQKPVSTNINDDNQALVSVALEAFYNLSKISDIRTIMKKRQLTSLIKNYTSIEMGEQRKLAFAILVQIMDEQEIKNNSAEMVAFFINELKQLDPNGHNSNIDHPLCSLEALIQHDQIKDELIKQDGLQEIVSFVRDGDPNKQSDKQLEDALKILRICTFNNPEVVGILKQDEKLMTRVNHLHEHAKQAQNVTLEKAAEGLIWKVEKEEKFKEQQEADAERKRQEKKQKAQENGTEEEEEEEEQYDLMISYSWADMDLAHRIFNHLTQNLGYKVWLDQEQMHGSTIEAMANAVDNAQFILLCMSETYKQSANCQSEAEYAFNRKKHIVLCKMTKDYTPDGWLGFILGTRMYIDFGTHEFEKAIELLDSEIQLQKKKRKEANAAAKAEKKAATDINNEKEEAVSHQGETDEELDVVTILSWNETVVRDFMMRRDLSSLVPLCDGINGEELLILYGMCKNSAASMFRSLKFELLNIHNKILPISTYLHFMSRIRLARPDNLLLNAFIRSKHPEDYLDDDD